MNLHVLQMSASTFKNSSDTFCYLECEKDEYTKFGTYLKLSELVIHSQDNGCE